MAGRARARSSSKCVSWASSRVEGSGPASRGLQGDCGPDSHSLSIVTFLVVRKTGSRPARDPFCRESAPPCRKNTLPETCPSPYRGARQSSLLKRGHETKGVRVCPGTQHALERPFPLFHRPT